MVAWWFCHPIPMKGTAVTANRLNCLSFRGPKGPFFFHRVDWSAIAVVMLVGHNQVKRSVCFVGRQKQEVFAAASRGGFTAAHETNDASPSAQPFPIKKVLDLASS
jgi:hypothetical protein